jgi:NAD(P)-dependent dehydrogenase (short-subunit alcohol dehydrogenase family)
MPVAIVTGAAGAIGSATSALLVKHGFTVVGIDTRPVLSPLHRGQGRVSITADLTDPTAVTSAFEQVIATVGTPTVLVNNAGIYRALEFLTTTADEFDAIYAANVRSAFLCGQAFAQAVLAADSAGAVVNVASVSGQMGSAYGASKGAVIALTKSMSRALARHRIRVNAVAPGVVQSAMSDMIPPARRAEYAQSIPLQRFAEPDEIARVILALASDTSAYMTGAVVDVNGGLHY